MKFTGGTVPQTPTPLVPQPQIVVPPITIPQGFSTKPVPQTYYQFTARGKEAAKRIPLGPNSKVAIFEEDPDKDVFYYRETDEYGNDVEFETCEYTKIEDPPEPEFLTKKEFYSAMDELVKKLKEDSSGQIIRTEGNTANGWYADKQSN